MKKLKIIYDFHNMSGGAPRSQLTHMLAMKEAGHTVVAIIGSDEGELRELVPDVEILLIESFDIKRPLANIRKIARWLQVLQAQLPDIIHSNRTSQFTFLAVVSDLSGIPLVFAQAGGVATRRSLLPMFGKYPVSYSRENLPVFLSSGFREEDVKLITNRLTEPTLSAHTRKIKKTNTSGPLKVVVIGNIKPSTINGLESFLDLIQKNTEAIFGKAVFGIAGKVVGLSRMRVAALYNKISSINNAASNPSFIKMYGWISEIEDLYKNFDIFIGKGRSVIEPALIGKVCFVLSEEAILTRINNTSFSSLYYYNFSGRGKQRDDTPEFLNLVSKCTNLNSFKKDAIFVQDRLKENYLASRVDRKLLDVYLCALEDSKSEKVRVLKAVCRYIYVYICSIPRALEKTAAFLTRSERTRPTR